MLVTQLEVTGLNVYFKVQQPNSRKISEKDTQIDPENLICPKKVIKFNCALKFHTTEPGVKQLTRLNCVTKMKVKSSEIFKNKVIDLANTFMCKIQPKGRQTLEDTQKLT